MEFREFLGSDEQELTVDMYSNEFVKAKLQNHRRILEKRLYTLYEIIRENPDFDENYQNLKNLYNSDFATEVTYIRKKCKNGKYLEFAQKRIDRTKTLINDINDYIDDEEVDNPVFNALLEKVKSECIEITFKKCYNIYDNQVRRANVSSCWYDMYSDSSYNFQNVIEEKGGYILLMYNDDNLIGRIFVFYDDINDEYALFNCYINQSKNEELYYSLDFDYTIGVELESEFMYINEDEVYAYNGYFSIYNVKGLGLNRIKCGQLWNVDGELEDLEEYYTDENEFWSDINFWFTKNIEIMINNMEECTHINDFFREVSWLAENHPYILETCEYGSIRSLEDFEDYVLNQ